MEIYLAVRESLFDRLTIKVPEEVKLKILLNNITPFYQTQLGLTKVNNQQELLKFGRLSESRRILVKSLVSPANKRSQKFLEPDLAYIDAEARLPHRTEIAEVTQHPHTEDSSFKRDRPCYNCQRLDHFSRECTFPRKPICFKCGKFNVTDKTCPTCSKNLRKKQ